MHYLLALLLCGLLLNLLVEENLLLLPLLELEEEGAGAIGPVLLVEVGELEEVVDGDVIVVVVVVEGVDVVDVVAMV